MTADYSVHLAEGDREKALWDDKLGQLVSHYEEILTRHDGTVAWVALMDAVKDVEPWKVRATLAAAVHKLTEKP